MNTSQTTKVGEGHEKNARQKWMSSYKLNSEHTE